MPNPISNWLASFGGNKANATGGDSPVATTTPAPQVIPTKKQPLAVPEMARAGNTGTVDSSDPGHFAREHGAMNAPAGPASSDFGGAGFGNGGTNGNSGGTNSGGTGTTPLNFGNWLNLLYNNYQMQGSERDLTNAETKANDYAKLLLDQINRTTGTADDISAALKKALGSDTDAKTQTDLLNAILNGNNGQGDINALIDLGKKREAWTAEDRDALNKVMTGAGDRLDALYESFGPAKMYGEGDVNDLASDIYNKKVGAVDRAVKLASSQGFADALTRGLSDSTQAADSRDAVARRFADVYSGLEADSRGQAVTQIGQLSDLQNKQRDEAISQLTNVINPELNARVQTYRPDTTLQTALTKGAEFGQDDLDRLERARKEVASDSQARVATLLGGLGTLNGQAINAGASLSTAASNAYTEAFKTFGANRNAVIGSAVPTIGSLTRDTLPLLIEALPAALGGVASTLTQWLNSGQQEVTPEVAQAIEQAYSSWAGQGVEGATDGSGLDMADWTLPDDWFDGWGGDFAEGWQL